MNNFIFRVVDFIANKLDLLILSPSYRSFGNSVEEIFFGLLYCQENKKKMILIRPFKSIFFKKITISNIYLYQLEHELIIKPSFLVNFFFRSLMSFLAGSIYLNITGRKIIAKIFNLQKSFYLNNDLSYMATQRFGINYLYGFSEKEIYDQDKWKKLESEYISPNLPRELIKTSEEFINNYAPNSLKKNWIVMHVLDNTKTDYARGADIKDYYLAIDYLIQKGFHVFRIGDNSMPACKREGLTDLAHIEHESFIDLYLIQKAFLFIGNQSGPPYATNLFKTDLLVTNLADWSTATPRRQGNFYINKIFYNKLNNKRIPISELLQKDFNFQVNTNKIDDRDVFLQDNSESEILDALKDYLNYLEGSEKYSLEQLTYNENRKKWLYNTLINNKDLKIHYSPKSKYNLTRIRSIALSTTSGTMAQSFLEKYWD
tara:strand:+ start:1239 stop:2528 length:1290 start_codon:yes stop_codon:yes gene_type:complete